MKRIICMVLLVAMILSVSVLSVAAADFSTGTLKICRKHGTYNTATCGQCDAEKAKKDDPTSGSSGSTKPGVPEGVELVKPGKKYTKAPDWLVLGTTGDKQIIGYFVCSGCIYPVFG